MPEDENQPRPPQRLAALREAVRRRAETDREARAAAEELRVVKLQETPSQLWLVMGRGGDYIVVPGSYCSCPHFQIRVASGETVEPCYHLVAVHIAEAEKRYHDLSQSLSPQQVEDIVLEALAEGRSGLLRRLLYLGRGGLRRNSTIDPGPGPG
jgi:predicted nucleic acid-binding Zn finger protein